jgi:hypothetical protein
VGDVCGAQRHIVYNDQAKIDDLKRLFPEAYRVDLVLLPRDRRTE